MFGKISAAAVLAMAAMAASTKTASADFVSTGSSGSLSAKVSFNLTGTTLRITLTNTTGVAVPDNTSLLTGVFWNSDAIGGTFDQLDLGGSTVIPDGSSTNIGMFGYMSSGSGPHSDSRGVGSAGFVTYNQTRLGPNASSPPNSPDGPAGGLVGASGISGNINGAVVKSSETWVITGVSANFNLGSITNVFFQYGTSLSEPGFSGGPPTDDGGGGGPQGAPLPAAAWGGMGLIGALAIGRKLRRKAVQA